MGKFASTARPSAMDKEAAAEEPPAYEQAVKETAKETAKEEVANEAAANDPAPSNGDAQDAAESSKSPGAGVFADVCDDMRNCTLASRPILHNTIHLFESKLVRWLGISPSQLHTLAMSGPVLKYLPAVHAVLTFPDSNPDEPCFLETETCIYAIGILFRENARAQLPTTLDAITVHHRIPAVTAAAIRDAPRIGQDPKRRGQILASIVIALRRDLEAAQIMGSQDYDVAFGRHVARFEKANPWGAEAYKCRVIPRDTIHWPNWGPVSRPESPCLYHGATHTLREHRVEADHRVLSTLRYSLRQHEPSRYYSPDGFGYNLRRVVEDVDFIHDRVATLQAEMREKNLAHRARERAEGREPAGDRYVRDLAARFPQDNALRILNWFVDNEDWHEQVWGKKGDGDKKADKGKGKAVNKE
ncbi:hypothetical protein ACRALDRAFT_1068332 [Sodiomyces alcalophilus JCM 7366]|uniref:uncharacterized protein n=1 Tax=Sodiomyces alcalophilus JCM 7366 TaxID=591952 RepID=UPI0039B57105